MTTIPVLDIAATVDGSDPDSVVAALRSAMTDVGFLQIVGHGVPLELIDATHDAVLQIDGLPDAERRALMRPRETSRGVFEQCDDGGHLLNRNFQFIPYDDLAEAEAAGAVGSHPDYFPPNVWPADPAFRATWKTYGEHTRRLSHLLMSLFARALELPADYFAEIFARDVSLFSANWYPPQPVSEAGDGAERVILQEHPDSGVLAVLHQRGNYEGLQVLDREGTWIPVPVRPDAYIINIGHLMSRWTNGVWPATVHRVVAGPTPECARSSVAMFFIPNLDHVIEPLPTMVGADGPRYEPVTTYDWQHQFMDQYVLSRYDWDSSLTDA